MKRLTIAMALLIVLAMACGEAEEQTPAVGKDDTRMMAQVETSTVDTDAAETPSTEPAAMVDAGGEFKWYHNWDEGMAAAKAANKPVLVHFTADWCKFCVQMKEETYAADMIQKRFIDGWVGIMIDTEDHESTGTVYVNESEKNAVAWLDGGSGFTQQEMGHAELLQFFGGRGLPTLLFIDDDGTPVQKISSFIPKEDFAVILDFFQEEAYKDGSFDDFKKKHEQRS